MVAPDFPHPHHPDVVELFSPSPELADRVQEYGAAAVRKPNPVKLVRILNPFSVQTNEGLMQGKAGDYLAYDPVTHRFWPIDPEYLAAHYRFLSEDGELP